MDKETVQELLDELIYRVNELNSAVFLEDLPDLIEEIKEIAIYLRDEIGG